MIYVISPFVSVLDIVFPSIFKLSTDNDVNVPKEVICVCEESIFNTELVDVKPVLPQINY